MSAITQRPIIQTTAAAPALLRGPWLPLAAAGLALLLVLTAMSAAMPRGVLAATTLAARCDSVNLRVKPRTTARTLRTLAAGAKVVAVAKVSGSHWSVKCAGSRKSASSWWRISSINGKSVKALYGVNYVYGATGLFKTVTKPVALAAACSGVALRAAPKTTATLKVRLASGTTVTAYGTVAGGSWSTSCSGSKVSGASWYRITAVNGKSVKSLFGVTYLYGARGLFRSPGMGSTSTDPSPTPTPTATPKPTPTPTPAPTPTPSPSTGYIEGIDISHWQGTINWTKVADSGKRFAFMKASEDTDYKDPTYATNRAQAKANGLYVGAYHFARPETTAGDAVSEADHFVDTAAPKSGELLPVLDLEVTGGLGVADLQAWTRTFLDRVYERTGVRAAIYVSPSFWSGKMGNTGWFAANGYTTLWVAHWTTASAPSLPASNWGGRGWTFWQYTSSGTVPGISGRVDLDRYRSGDFTPVLIP